MCACICACVHAYACVHMWLCVQVIAYMCVHVCTCVRVCMHMWPYACACVCGDACCGFWQSPEVYHSSQQELMKTDLSISSLLPSHLNCFWAVPEIFRGHAQPRAPSQCELMHIFWISQTTALVRASDSKLSQQEEENMRHALILLTKWGIHTRCCCQNSLLHSTKRVFEEIGSKWSMYLFYLQTKNKSFCTHRWKIEL